LPWVFLILKIFTSLEI